MMTPSIQLGERVRRRNDTGLDTPGAVVRVSDIDVMVYWPSDNYFQLVPVTDLEVYGMRPSAFAA